jgi:hypothetical protein
MIDEGAKTRIVNKIATLTNSIRKTGDLHVEDWK